MNKPTEARSPVRPASDRERLDRRRPLRRAGGRTVAFASFAACLLSLAAAAIAPQEVAPEAASATSSPVESIEQLLQRHVEAIGGADAVDSLRTLRRTGVVSTEGAIGSYEGPAEEIYDYAGDRGFATFDIQVFVQDSGWIGQDGWKNSSMQGVTEIDADELTLIKMSSAVSPLYYLWKRYGAAAFSNVEPSSFADAETIAVSVANSALVIHLDAESLRVVAMVIPGSIETRYTEFAEVEGVTVPATVQSEIPAAGITFTHRFEEQHANVELEATRFEKPDV